jgi:hypothetical protein
MLQELDWDDDDEVTLARDGILPSLEPFQPRIEILNVPEAAAAVEAPGSDRDATAAADGAADWTEAEVTVRQALPPGAQLPPPRCPPRRQQREAPATEPDPNVTEDFATIQMAPFEDIEQLREAAQGLAGDTLVDFVVPPELRETTVAVQVTVEDELEACPAMAEPPPATEPVSDHPTALSDEDDSPPTMPSSRPPASSPSTPEAEAVEPAPETALQAVAPPAPPNVDDVLAELEVLPVDDDRPLRFDLPRNEASDRPAPPQPARQPEGSLPPVALSDPPPRRAPRRAAALVALGCVALACALAVWWSQPREGTLVVRLRTADGSPAAKAEIFVDGQKRCDTDPCVVDSLAPGTKAVKVLVPGFSKPRVGHAQVVAGDRQVLWVAVPTRQGVKLTSPQPAVRLFVDGVDRGVLPAGRLDLEPGNHHLRLVAPGFTTEERTIEVPVGEVVDLGAIVLAPVTPQLAVELAGERARVVLVAPSGERRALSGPWPQHLELEPGRYTVLAHRRGYRPFTHEVELTAEQPSQQVRIELERARATSPMPATPRRSASAEPGADEAANDDDPYES